MEPLSNATEVKWCTLHTQVKAAGGLTGIFPGSYLDVVMDDPAPATKAAAPQAPQQLAPAAPVTDFLQLDWQ